MAYYIDTSALVKLVTVENETRALHEWVASVHPVFVSSDLLRTEFLRAVRRSSAASQIDIEDGLEAIDTIPATQRLFDAAGLIDPPGLRTLDALHLTVALDLADECEGVVTYDARLAQAARAHDLDVIAPA